MTDYTASGPRTQVPISEITRLQAKVERLRGSLRFYADADNWSTDDDAWERAEVGDESPETLDGLISKVEADGGETARAALRETGTETVHPDNQCLDACVMGRKAEQDEIRARLDTVDAAVLVRVWSEELGDYHIQGAYTRAQIFGEGGDGIAL